MIIIGVLGQPTSADQLKPEFLKEEQEIVAQASDWVFFSTSSQKRES